MFTGRLRWAAVLLTGAVCNAVSFADDRSVVDFFERKIRPVLVEHCYSCHSQQAVAAKKLKGGLRVDDREALRRGGESGPAVVPGKPADSLLLKSLRFDGDTRMPPKGKLPESVVKDFEKWIADGAADPRSAVVAAPKKGGIDVAAGRQFWSFQSPRSITAPTPAHASESAIDAWIGHGLKSAGRGFNPPADPAVSVRRVYFDLIGLPPPVEVVERYVRDPSERAWEQLVDGLLASPAFGERWARMWLDVARFAEDQAHIVGNDASLTYPNAYLYRDWVIQAFNADLPYDQFIKLQLAADVIEGESGPNLAALGFIGLGPKYYDRKNPMVMAEEYEDRVDVVGRGLLGLTLACARCHDHKFDPIRTEDYYGIAGVFAGTRMYNRRMTDKVEANKDGEAKAPKDGMHIVREGTPTNLPVAIRGDVNNKGPVVARRFPMVLSEQDASAFKSGSGRKELAEAIANVRNPLTARVFVNRVWATFFGRGLVTTPSNFGKLGEFPTHPELLDDLAVRFMNQGWSLKTLCREVVKSRTYRQSSAFVDADPDNRLFGRMPRKRLTVEQWRDSVLSAAGTLDTTRIGGPSVDPADPNAVRRTIYSKVSRLELNRLLAMFDYPDPNVTAERRAETTTPLQKLFLLNSKFMAVRSADVAERIMPKSLAVSDGDRRSAIESAYLLLFARKPTAAESAIGLRVIGSEGGTAEKDGWKRYAHALLASNEMFFVD